MSTARCCSGSSLVIDDAAAKEMDGDGEELGLWIVWAVEIADFKRNAKFPCDAGGFIVAVI